MGRVHPILLLFRFAKWGVVTRPEMAQKLEGASYIIIIIVQDCLAKWGVVPRPEMAQKLEGASYIIIIIIKDCLAKWGVVPRPEMANMMFGGRKLEGASNIVFR